MPRFSMNSTVDVSHLLWGAAGAVECRCTAGRRGWAGRTWRFRVNRYAKRAEHPQVRQMQLQRPWGWSSLFTRHSEKQHVLNWATRKPGEMFVSQRDSKGTMLFEVARLAFSPSAQPVTFPSREYVF
jgi:hypothetical protein